MRQLGTSITNVKCRINSLELRSGRTGWRFCSKCTGNASDAISKAYNPRVVEAKLLGKWNSRGGQTKGRVNSSPFTGDEVFRMILPPPNVTGKLHLGHALTVTIQDSIIRWKAMTGSCVKWIPGFDHAGIATHNVVLKQLEKSVKDKKDSRDLDEAVLQQALSSFASSNRSHIGSQLQRLGALLDWTSEYYTLDEKHKAVVEKAFVRLYEDGLIQRKLGLVNWCSVLKTSIADVECVSAEFDGYTTFRIPGYETPVGFGKLYNVEYMLKDAEGTLTVATSRPETIFGDVALAVNPEDSRFSEMIGRTAVNPLTGNEIPVLADSHVKIDFGTGVLKLTPAHDQNDFKIGRTHDLPIVNVFEEDGTLNELCGEFAGLRRFDARDKVINYLKEKNLFIGTKNYKGSLQLCSRTGDVIEPRALPHWFFKTKDITEDILAKVQSNELTIRPEFGKKELFNSLSTPEDWCLSRQIKWGHSIPAYYQKEFPEKWTVALSLEGACEQLSQLLGTTVDPSEVKQDPDVLDTWFSSALIPVAVAGWPVIKDEEYRPLSLMETGNDILLYWVWRMALVTLALVKQLPFHQVYLHGLVTDQYNRKMSKSKGNVIDPMDIIDGKTMNDLLEDTERSFAKGELNKDEYKLRKAGLKHDLPNGIGKCGADALRLTLLSQDIFKNEIRLDFVNMESCRHFTNKMWQAMRFYFFQADLCTNGDIYSCVKPSKEDITSIPDLWILASLHEYTKVMEEGLNLCNFHSCVESTRAFLHHQYCDFYIEMVKNDLKEGVDLEKRLHIMRYVFVTFCRLAHPLIPYISEEMHSLFTKSDDALVDLPYPKSDETIDFQNEDLLKNMQSGIKVCGEIRSLRKRSGAGGKTTVTVRAELTPSNEELAAILPCFEIQTNTKIVFEPQADSEACVTSIVEYQPGKCCRIHMPKVNVTERSEEQKLMDKRQAFKGTLKELMNSANQENIKEGKRKEIMKKVDKLEAKIAKLEEDIKAAKVN